MKIALFIIAAIALFIMFAKFEAWRRARKIEAVFGGRDALDSEQFYERYFKQKGVPLEVVSGVKCILAEQLSADMSRITDADDFSKNLKFFWDFDSLADVEIVCALEDVFNIKITDDEARRSRTVSDIVFLVHAKILEISEA